MTEAEFRELIADMTEAEKLELLAFMEILLERQDRGQLITDEEAYEMGVAARARIASQQ